MADKKSDDLDDEDLEAFEEEQEEFAEGIRDAVLDYVEENEVPEGTAIWTLMELAVSMHMSGYMVSTEKPSVQGLKMELDRLGNDIQELVREAKKGAEEFIKNYKEAEQNLDDDDDED